MTKPATPEADSSAIEQGRIQFVDRDGQPWVILHGEIDYAVVGQVSDSAIAAKYRPGCPFNVDMTEVTFVDSMAIALLMRLYNLEKTLRVVNVPPRARQVFTIMGLAAVLGISDLTSGLGLSPVVGDTGSEPVTPAV